MQFCEQSFPTVFNHQQIQSLFFFLRRDGWRQPMRAMSQPPHRPLVCITFWDSVDTISEMIFVLTSITGRKGTTSIIFPVLRCKVSARLCLFIRRSVDCPMLLTRKPVMQLFSFTKFVLENAQSLNCSILVHVRGFAFTDTDEVVSTICWLSLMPLRCCVRRICTCVRLRTSIFFLATHEVWFQKRLKNLHWNTHTLPGKVQGASHRQPVLQEQLPAQTSRS